VSEKKKLLLIEHTNLSIALSPNTKTEPFSAKFTSRQSKQIPNEYYNKV